MATNMTEEIAEDRKGEEQLKVFAESKAAMKQNRNARRPPKSLPRLICNMHSYDMLLMILFLLIGTSNVEGKSIGKAVPHWESLTVGEKDAQNPTRTLGGQHPKGSLLSPAPSPGRGLQPLRQANPGTTTDMLASSGDVACNRFHDEDNSLTTNITITHNCGSAGSDGCTVPLPTSTLKTNMVTCCDDKTLLDQYTDGNLVECCEDFCIMDTILLLKVPLPVKEFECMMSKIDGSNERAKYILSVFLDDNSPALWICLGIIVGVVLPLLIIIFISCWCCWKRYNRDKHQVNKGQVEKQQINDWVSVEIQNV